MLLNKLQEVISTLYCKDTRRKLSSDPNLREKFVKQFVRDYTGRCPKCKEQGQTKVLPFGDDFWFCENPNCKIIRHSNVGYYILTDESIQAPNVFFVQTVMMIKRK